jgi:hypothetical protein
MSRALILAITLALTPAAFAQQPAAPACATKDANLPAHLAAWTQKAEIQSSARPAGLANLVPGKAYTSKLHPAAGFVFATVPEKLGAANTTNGLFALKVEQAGTYGVALGAPGWIDVVKGGKALKSVTHGHGPECSTIRKIVNFDLQPGDYIVQVAGHPEPAASIMVLRQP